MARRKLVDQSKKLNTMLAVKLTDHWYARYLRVLEKSPYAYGSQLIRELIENYINKIENEERIAEEREAFKLKEKSQYDNPRFVS